MAVKIVCDQSLSVADDVKPGHSGTEEEDDEEVEEEEADEDEADDEGKESKIADDEAEENEVEDDAKKMSPTDVRISTCIFCDLCAKCKKLRQS